MKVFEKNHFFQSFKLTNLPEERKEIIWAKFLELVSLEVLDNILDELPALQQEKLFLNLAKSPSKVLKFLEKNPKVAKFTPAAFAKLKKEVWESFEKK